MIWFYNNILPFGFKPSCDNEGFPICIYFKKAILEQHMFLACHMMDTAANDSIDHIDSFGNNHLPPSLNQSPYMDCNHQNSHSFFLHQLTYFHNMNKWR